MTQKQFYKSVAWKRFRKAFIAERIAIDGGICQVCGEAPGLIAHHTVWLDDINCNDPEISLNKDLLRYECQDCHNKEEDPRKACAERRIRYLADGTVVNAGRY